MKEHCQVDCLTCQMFVFLVLLEGTSKRSFKFFEKFDSRKSLNVHEDLLLEGVIDRLNDQNLVVSHKTND